MERLEEGEEETLENLRSRGKEGDRAKGGTFILWLAGLGEGVHRSFLPDSGDVRLSNGEVKEGGQKENALRAQMLEVKGSEPVRPYST